MELSRNSIGGLILFILVHFQPMFGQFLPINWGPLEPKQGQILDVLPIRSGDFYTLRYSGGVLGSYRSTLHNQLSFVSQARIKPVTETGYGNVETGTYFGEKLFVFISDRNNGNMGLYSMPLEEDGSGEVQLRCSYNDSRVGARPNFQISRSQNGKFLAIYYEIPGRKQDRDVYGYVVYDTLFNKVQEGEYLVPFDGNMTTINQHHITNYGDYLLVLTEHIERNDKTFNKNWENFKALHVYKIANDSLIEFQVSLENKRIDDILISSNDQEQVALTGLYGEGKQMGIEGIFTITVDLSKDSINAYKYSPFNRELLHESNSEQQMNRMERRWENRDENPQIYAYKLRQIQTLSDGSQVGFMEQYYERKYTNYDTRTGITTVNYYYYFMDIGVFKLDQNGNCVWGKRIPKSQISMNDYGPFSSFVACNNESKAYVIFNDNKQNYDEGGVFINRSAVQGLSLSNRRNVVAISQIDLNTGNIDRNVFFSRKELSAIVVPKQMQIDWKNKELLLYAINGNREKFGLLSFK